MEGTYETSHLVRARWNVIDLLNHISTKATSADLFCHVDVEEADRLCMRLSTSGKRITITALLLKAIAVVQDRCPDSRSYRLPLGKKITAPEPIAGFTVEREVESGPAVFFGVIRGAHKKSLADIAGELSACGNNELDSVAQMAKERFLSKVPWLLRQLFIVIALHFPFLRHLINPSTFGLTSLGKFGIQSMAGPNVTTSIFGIGSIEPKAVVRNNRIVIRKQMTICLCADIAVLNIYQAARLLHDVKDLVESGLQGHLTDGELEQLEALAEGAAKGTGKSEKTSGGGSAQPSQAPGRSSKQPPERRKRPSRSNTSAKQASPGAKSSKGKRFRAA